MPLIEFVGQSSSDADNGAANTSRLVNCYREPVDAGGRSRMAIKSVLGQEDYATVDAVSVQAMTAIGGVLHVVCGGKLFRIVSSGDGGELGSVIWSENSAISSNTGQVTITAGGRYFLWTGTAMTEPTAGAFSAFGSVDYLGGYTILTELDGRRVQWSDLADPSDLPGLNFATAETTDEAIIRAFQIGGVLFVFKENGYERWGITGEAGAGAFARLPGAEREIGLKSFNLISRIPDGAFFVGSDGRAYIAYGGEPAPISTPSVETAIHYLGPQRCFFFEDEGHAFCAITFDQGYAWVFDIATREWHERSESGGIWPVAATAKIGGVWFGARDDGRVVKFTRNNRDLGLPLIRVITSRALYMSEPFTVASVEFFGRIGIEAEVRRVLLDTTGDPELLETGFDTVLEVDGYDVDPGLVLEVSGDGGHTFGRQRVLTFGRPGDYKARMIARALGQFRRPMVARLTMASPTETPIYADAEVVLS